MRALVWFRRDLRLDDQRALYEAARRADRGVVGVYLISPASWMEHDEAPIKIDFWLRTLRELSSSLAAKNIPLRIERADHFNDAPRVLLRVAEAHGCDELFFNREYEVNERSRDASVQRAFDKAGRTARLFTDRVILEPGDVRTQADQFYSVYTPFKRRWQQVVMERGVEVLPPPRKQAETGIAPSKVPQDVAGFESFALEASVWPAGEKEALRRLARFIEKRIDRYAVDRDSPATDGTSTLSPYLAAGAISPRRCLHAAMEANGGRLDVGKQGAVVWMQELIWREFYQHVLVAYPRVSMGLPFRLETQQVRWAEDASAFSAWCEGRTGFPIVDAAMRQLRAIGWMHNRLRMIVAMFLTKDLLIDWRLGERFFMQHLIDGDLAANNGGWQWSASTGTDAAPYFRIFNPASQSRKFDPDGAFIRRYCPELAQLEGDAVHEPSALPPLMRGMAAYPDPIVDHAKARDRALHAFKAVKS